MTKSSPGTTGATLTIGGSADASMVPAGTAEQGTPDHFEAYCQRTLGWFTSAEPPGGCDPATWRTARQFARAQAAHRFGGLVCDGWLPHEVAADRLDPGAEIGSGGQVRRPPAAKQTEATRVAAAEALRELQRLTLRLSPVFEQTLDLAAIGQWRGQASAVDAALNAAHYAITAKHGENVSARATKAAAPTMTVHRTFRGPAGRQWEPGQYRLSAAERADIATWVGKLEAEASRRGWGKPEGFDTWPPFTITEPQA